MSDGEGTPSFAHDCHSLYAPPPPIIVSLTFLYSDVVFLPSLTWPVLLKDIKESENIASLHNQIASCDTILEVM